MIVFSASSRIIDAETLDCDDCGQDSDSLWMRRSTREEIQSVARAPPIPTHSPFFSVKVLLRRSFRSLNCVYELQSRLCWVYL